jgi:hypothetical protein
MTKEGTMPDTDIEDAARLWMTGRPLEAGRALTALVPPADRPRWAGQVLAWAYARSGIAPVPAIDDLLATLQRPVTPDKATALHTAIAEVLVREEESGRFDSLREAVLTLALNAARLLLATTEPNQPDPKTGWWFVARLKCVGDVLDDDFGAEAWAALSHTP